tara:strand:+ start:448 stop:618 length:171 start_codon:yes stop_codon:yes gene_type:complete
VPAAALRHWECIPGTRHLPSPYFKKSLENEFGKINNNNRRKYRSKNLEKVEEKLTL